MMACCCCRESVLTRAYGCAYGGLIAPHDSTGEHGIGTFDHLCRSRRCPLVLLLVSPAVTHPLAYILYPAPQPLSLTRQPPPPGFLRIIKYQGGGVQDPLPPSHKPPLPPPFHFCKSSVLWFVTVHTYWGSPIHRRGPNLLSIPLSLLSALPTLRETQHWGPETASLPKLLFLFFFIFSFLSVKRRYLQVWCQGRPRGSLAGCGGPRGRLAFLSAPGSPGEQGRGLL